MEKRAEERDTLSRLCILFEVVKANCQVELIELGRKELLGDYNITDDATLKKFAELGHCHAGPERQTKLLPLGCKTVVKLNQIC